MYEMYQLLQSLTSVGLVLDWHGNRDGPHGCHHCKDPHVGLWRSRWILTYKGICVFVTFGFVFAGACTARYHGCNTFHIEISGGAMIYPAI